MRRAVCAVDVGTACMSRTRGEAFASPRVGSAFDYLVAALAVATFLGFAVYPANARKWSDKTGSFSVEGELMAATDKDVVLKRADGNMMRVLLETLSDADREYVRQWGMPQDPSSDPGNPANAASATPRNASPSPRAPVPARTARSCCAAPPCGGSTCRT